MGLLLVLLLILWLRQFFLTIKLFQDEKPGTGFLGFLNFVFDMKWKGEEWKIIFGLRQVKNKRTLIKIRVNLLLFLLSLFLYFLVFIFKFIRVS